MKSYNSQASQVTPAGREHHTRRGPIVNLQSAAGIIQYIFSAAGTPQGARRGAGVWYWGEERLRTLTQPAADYSEDVDGQTVEK